jgi:glycerophosphoryl diester phosphodiesterase
MIIIGHRGAAEFEPENTIISFRKAMELNVDMIEFDVQLCKSGEVVVIHDYTLERTTNGEGFVFEKTFEELRVLDAGNGQKIPDLVETLNTINRKTKVNIELKGVSSASHVSNIINYFIEKKNWHAQDFIVSSFHQMELFKFHLLNPNINIGVLFNEIPENFFEIANKVDAYSINADFRFLTKNVVDKIHSLGFKIFAYTVNKAEDKALMKLIGVDGIFTDSP